MSERVAVYIDFDNVVISRYDDMHGKQAWREDDPRPSQAILTLAGRPSRREAPGGTQFVAAATQMRTAPASMSAATKP